MNNLYFITGNSGKFREAKSIIPNIEQMDIDLPEIQELDAKKIIEEKLQEAIKEMPGKRFFCEDTSLYINSLGGLPGPLIKWFLEAIGDKGISDLIEKHDDKVAVAKTIVGYADGDKILFFEGDIEGEIVPPRGENGFGWDKLFKPKNSDKTFGEMELKEKEKFSMRRKALIKLKDYLGEENGE